MERKYLTGAAGLKLAADVAGDPMAQPVVMLHGGGQTRHSWGALTETLAGNGYHAMTVDMRGHGESDWAPDGDYTLDRFADDVHGLLAGLSHPPVLIGASLGGLSALMASAGLGRDRIRGLVLVDIAPKVEAEG
ncbi:alpha/beta fold hydrolase, partial [uncultured Marinobacter sp.]|uniref:alpha/beta fold hydrolase n=1 Tax=uncultured Marinobacter sp. TaxID=187379 RepID=UPI0030D78A44